MCWINKAGDEIVCWQLPEEYIDEKEGKALEDHLNRLWDEYTRLKEKEHNDNSNA